MASTVASNVAVSSSKTPILSPTHRPSVGIRTVPCPELGSRVRSTLNVFMLPVSFPTRSSSSRSARMAGEPPHHDLDALAQLLLAISLDDDVVVAQIER